MNNHEVAQLGTSISVVSVIIIINYSNCDVIDKCILSDTVYAEQIFIIENLKYLHVVFLTVCSEI